LEKFDYIHIDGDHSLEGKLADLELSRSLLKPGGLVLVDDYHHMPAVPEAIQRAWALAWYHRFALAPTDRGLAILS
jgi:predicted O-methyltransferase YrrM